MKCFFNLLITTVLYLFISTEVTGQTEARKFSIHAWESIEAPGMMLQGVLIGSQNHKIGIQAGRTLMSYQEEYVIGTDALVRFHTFNKKNHSRFLYGRVGLRYAFVEMNPSKFHHLSVRHNIGYGFELFDRLTLSIDTGIGRNLAMYIKDDTYFKLIEQMRANPMMCFHFASPHIPKVFVNASLNAMFRIY